MATPANLMSPRMEELLVRVDSKFTLVTLSAMRAREINDYYNQLGEGLGKIVPPQVTSVSRKPLSIALEEIEADKIEYRRVGPVGGGGGAPGAAPRGWAVCPESRSGSPSGRSRPTRSSTAGWSPSRARPRA